MPLDSITNWGRRQLLGYMGALPAAMLAACAGTANGGVKPPWPRQRLIDAHCHVFNITDLPAWSFIEQAMLGVEPGPSLPNQILREALKAIEAEISAGVIDARTEATGQSGAFVPDGGPVNEDQLRRQQKRAKRALKELGAAQALLSCPDGPSLDPSIPSIVRWLRSIRSPRAGLVRMLAAAQRASGYEPAMLCPALVDYSNWLGQPLKSSLEDQVAAMATVAANPALPPVHGYVAFDPLRRALVREGRGVIDGTWDPLVLARKALTRDGFAGVKLYPPMGFRASGNAGVNQNYTAAIEAKFGSAHEVGRALDESLDELWKLCFEVDAPVMAHAAASNGIRKGFGSRADPSHWFPVVEKHPSLRILLAHFGRFRDQTSTTGQPPECPDDEVPFERTWEAAIGRFVGGKRDCMLFADLSYLNELFHLGYRDRALLRLQQYLQLDPGGRHLVFGSDWVMLGIERKYAKAPGYPGRVAEFLAAAGLGPAEVDGVMYGNAARFLGLGSGSRARDRLIGFYRSRGLAAKPLPGGA